MPRPARPDDAPALARLFQGLAEHQQEDPIDIDASRLEAHLFGARPRLEAVVAEADARLVGPLVGPLIGPLIGYASFLPSYESSVTQAGLYLADLYVVPQARRRGTARRLVAAVAAIARSRGLTYVGWLSRDWNADARAFYATLGAIEVPVTAHAVFGPAFDALADEGDLTPDRPAAPR